MRGDFEKLTEEEYRVYGVKKSDFEYTINLVREVIQDRRELYEQREEVIRKESPDVCEDILDDINYYRYLDDQFLWQFALWRLQGLFEAVIVHQLSISGNAHKLRGLASKINALSAAGYEISKSEKESLMNWAKLRNALSHAPPEQFRPIPIGERDISEYWELLDCLIRRWTSTDGSSGTW